MNNTTVCIEMLVIGAMKSDYIWSKGPKARDTTNGHILSVLGTISKPEVVVVVMGVKERNEHWTWQPLSRASNVYIHVN